MSSEVALELPGILILGAKHARQHCDKLESHKLTEAKSVSVSGKSENEFTKFVEIKLVNRNRFDAQFQNESTASEL